MELAYRQNGDYLIPDIEMDEQPKEQIGKYGMMRKAFLKAHRSGTYNALLLQNKLTEHLLEIDRTAREQIEQTMAQMMSARARPIRRTPKDFQIGKPSRFDMRTNGS